MNLPLSTAALIKVQFTPEPAVRTGPIRIYPQRLGKQRLGAGRLGDGGWGMEAGDTHVDSPLAHCSKGIFPLPALPHFLTQIRG